MSRLKKQKFFTTLLPIFLLHISALSANDNLNNRDITTTTLHEEKLLNEQSLSTFYKDETSIGSCKCDYNRRFTFYKSDKKQLDLISNEVYQYAIMSSNSYNRDTQVKLPDWNRVKRVVSSHGFSADIYISNNKREVVIAFRGTDDKKDWKYGNIAIDVNGQYNDADELFKLVKSEYGQNIKITTTGHSLGGGLAIHVSLRNRDVNAFVFNPSPRFFSTDSYDKYNNRVVIVYESGEILSLIRPLFTTLRKIKYEKYMFNFLGGNSVSEHGIEAFARCMYASINVKKSKYNELCKDNTLLLK